MNYAYREEDELNFDQVDGAYDGSEYQLDEFGERIDGATDDIIDDDIATDAGTDSISEDTITEDEATPETKIENGFGEIINPANSEHLTDQIDDKNLNTEARADIESNQTDADRPGDEPITPTL